MKRKVHAIVPVKSLALSKSRLSENLCAAERGDLCALMLRNVLRALAGAAGIDGATVVSRDPAVWQIARDFGFDTLEDKTETGPTDAILIASARHGAGTGLLALMADLPLITSTDIDQIVQTWGTSPVVTLVPSHDGRGTNAAFWSPPGQFRFLFNGRGLSDNSAMATLAGTTPTVLHLPRVALDLDTVEDLALVSDRCPDPAIVAALSMGQPGFRELRQS